MPQAQPSGLERTQPGLGEFQRRPVYFVQDRWYNDVYVPRYRERHGYREARYDDHRDRGEWRDERGGYRGDRDDDRPDRGGRGHGNGNGKGHGHGHGRD